MVADTNTWSKQLQEGKAVLVSGFREYSSLTGNTWLQEKEAGWSQYVSNQEGDKEQKVG